MKKQLGIGLALAVLLSGVSCGGGGGGDVAGGNLGGEYGELKLLEHEPAADALQVDVDTEITLSFDGAIDPAALVVQEMALYEDGLDEPIEGTFRVSNGGRTVHFKPSVALEVATDYRFDVQPTLCDQSYRTLDVSPSFAFRTFDEKAPELLRASIVDRQTSVDRRAPIIFEFDEALDPSSARPGAASLRDEWGGTYPVELAIAHKTASVTCIHDLPGTKSLFLTLRGGDGAIRDRSGNEFATSHTIRFTTAADTTAPSFVRSFPIESAIAVSPRARIELQFDEAMDPNSYEPSGLFVVDAFENPVAVDVTLSSDLRTIRLEPRAPLRMDDDYLVRATTGPSGLADVSGNGIIHAVEIAFRTGSDIQAPNITSTLPRDNERDVPTSAAYEIQFDELLDPTSVSRRTVELLVDEVPVVITVRAASLANRILIQPVHVLPADKACRIELAGGRDGIRDANGNEMAASHTVNFTTTADSRVPKLLFAPQDGASAVPVTSRVVIMSSLPLRPSSVSSDTVRLTDANNNRIQGSLTVENDGRAIIFRPHHALASASSVRIKILGGLRGVRGTNGSGLAEDIESYFRTGGHADTLPPEMSLTLNRVAKTRREGLAVPPAGFTIDMSSYDLGSATVDPSTLTLSLTGPAFVPAPAELFAATTFSGNLRARTRLTIHDSLEPGAYSLTATIRDLSGNLSASETLRFQVDEATTDRRPFERTQLVWVQFDTDREGGGRGDGKADFVEDMHDLGLGVDGDPIGANDKLAQLVIDGAIRVANDLFGRTANSGRIDEDSIRLRLVTRQPCGAPHMKIAVGGLDSGGSGNRKYGDESTGVLGRALFDYRNAVVNENNTGTSPGLGVFVGELFLYQARLYLDLYPHYITRFGRTYRGLSPHMGGVPAGRHAHDAKVLADDFDYGSASPEERARWDLIHDAADQVARAIGVVLTHEIGHSIGLVPEGSPSSGLHGDTSLHNTFSGIDDVMSAILGYESLTTIDFSFRPLNLAYLRERVILK